MAEDYKSKLKFVNYIVDSVVFQNNPNFETEDVTIQFDIKPQYIMDEEENGFILALDVNVFENAVQNNYPFELSIKILGYFKMEGDGELQMFHRNAMAIMYPYIRSLVTGYTAHSNVSPLILPVINVNAMFQNEE